MVKGQDRKPVAYCDPDRALPSKPDNTDHRPLKHTGSYSTSPGPNYLHLSSSATASGDSCLTAVRKLVISHVQLEILDQLTTDSPKYTNWFTEFSSLLAELPDITEDSFTTFYMNLK